MVYFWVGLLAIIFRIQFRLRSRTEFQLRNIGVFISSYVVKSKSKYNRIS